jgi:hypothetical protein
VTSTAATLTGTVNPSSRATTWYFEYGTSTSYGKKTTTQSAGSGTSPVPVSAQITGLTTGHTYHFRVVATSDAGTSRGSDRTFLPTAAPTVTTKSPTSVKDTSATLQGAVIANGQSTSAYFEYGTSTSYGTKTAAKSVGSGTGSTGVAIAVTGLAPGVTYHVRIVGSNASGTTAGADVAFSTTGAPAVQTGSATGATASGATLTGAIDSRGHSTTWYFQYGRTAGYGLQTRSQSQSSTSGSRPVSAAIAGLAAGATYHYRLVASNSIGTTVGADMSFRTAGPDVSLVTSSRTVVAGRAVRLSGRVVSGRDNEVVTVFAQRYGSGSFARAATVLTDPGGVWSVVVRPGISTVYKGTWNGTTSSTVAVGVRPAVAIRVLSRARFATRVGAARSFAGRTVQLQRRLRGGRWQTIAHRRLSRHSTAVFRPFIPRGVTSFRIAISVNQSGPGYLAGFSRAIVLQRR